MKKFFTLIAAVAMAASVNAQTQEWNFSKWNAATFNETTTQDGLTVYAGKDSKGNPCAVTVDANNKTIDGVKYTQRLKFGGKGDFVDNATPNYRVLAFDVTGACDVYVACTTSNKTDAKELYVDALATGASEKTNIGKISLAANEIKGETVHYTGGAGKIFLYPNGGLNIYTIKVTSGTSGISNINASEAANEGATFNLMGQKVASNAKGLVIKNGKKFINK